MPIQKFEIRKLGPFDDIQFQFDRQVNVFIGPNNCGKSTVLMALAEAIVFPFSVPERLYRGSEGPQLSISLWDNAMQITQKLPREVQPEDIAMMKQLGYTGFVPALRENTGFRPRSPMGKGTREPHVIRTTRGYQVIPTRAEIDTLEYDVIPSEEYDVIPSRIAYEQNLLRRRGKSKLPKADEAELEKRRVWVSSPSVITDQAIVSKIVELDYRAYRKNDPRFRNIIEVAASVASEIMSGFMLGFGSIEENKRGLYPQYNTQDGALPLDKLSQGTQSVIQWVSHLILGMAEYYDFPVDLINRPAVLIIDEIDAHMHPEWQRRIIPALIKNLPNCQLFVSTHSPLILSGLGEGQAQLLNRDMNNKVVVSTNDQETVGWSVDEIMRWLMGMTGTFDSETERVAADLEQLRKKGRLTKAEQEQLNTLREEIRARLLR